MNKAKFILFLVLLNISLILTGCIIEDFMPGMGDIDPDDVYSRPIYWEHYIAAQEIRVISTLPENDYCVEYVDPSLEDAVGVDVWKILPNDSWIRLESVLNSSTGIWMDLVHFFSENSNRGRFVYYTDQDETGIRIVIFASLYRTDFDASEYFEGDWPPPL